MNRSISEIMKPKVKEGSPGSDVLFVCEASQSNNPCDRAISADSLDAFSPAEIKKQLNSLARVSVFLVQGMPLDLLRSARFGFPYCPAIVFVRRNFLVTVILDRPRLEAFFKIRIFCVYAWRREEKVYFTKCQVTDTAALGISLCRSGKDLRRLYISQCIFFSNIFIDNHIK